MTTNNTKMSYTVPVSREDIAEEYTLPNLKSFKSNAKVGEDIPYLKLYKWLAKKRRVEVAEIHVMDVIVTPNVVRKLRKFTNQYLLKNHSYLRNTNKLIFEVGMLDLNFGPVEANEDWMVDSKIYIRKHGRG